MISTMVSKQAISVGAVRITTVKQEKISHLGGN